MTPDFKTFLKEYISTKGSFAYVIRCDRKNLLGLYFYFYNKESGLSSNKYVVCFGKHNNEGYEIEEIAEFSNSKMAIDFFDEMVIEQNNSESKGA